MRALILVALASMWSALASAQVDIKREVAKCAAMEGDAERLECFDDLARRLGVGGPTITPLAGKGKWVVKEEKSPIDDSRNVYLALTAENPITDSYGQAVTPTLLLRCKENETNAIISFDVYLGIDQTTLLVRLDAEEAKRSTWSIATNNKAIFAPNTVGFVRELMKHDKLLVQVVPYGEGAVMTTFDLRGLTEAIKPLQVACGWE
jgi:type VI secretion system protein VasI